MADDPPKKLPPAGQIPPELLPRGQIPYDSIRPSPSLPDPPIREPGYRPPPPPKNDLIGIILAGLTVAAILIAFALAYWWLKR